jgi:hypothetical protein
MCACIPNQEIAHAVDKTVVRSLSAVPPVERDQVFSVCRASLHPTDVLVTNHSRYEVYQSP